MFATLRARQPGHSLWRIGWWYLLHFVCFISCGLVYRHRVWGTHRIPRHGPVLFVANHQSFLDPILVGLGGHRRQFYGMARETLWHNRILGLLMNSLNAIPVDQTKGDTAAMRRCIDVLRRSHALLVFPEGARTFDGQLVPFARGIMVLIKRAKPTVVPVAIEGAYRVWPRTRKLPRPFGCIGVMFGEPVLSEQLMAAGSERALELLRWRVDTMRYVIRARLAGSNRIDRRRLARQRESSIPNLR